MKDIHLTITRRTTFIFILVLFLLALFWIVNVKASPTYHTCRDLYRVTGRDNIPKGDSLYNAAMDRDKDNVACDE